MLSGPHDEKKSSNIIEIPNVPYQINLEALDPTTLSLKQVKQVSPQRSKLSKDSHSNSMSTLSVTESVSPKKPLQRAASVDGPKAQEKSALQFFSKKELGKAYAEMHSGNDDFIVTNISMGKGAYGKFVLAQNKKTGQWVGVKKQLQMPEESGEQFQRRISQEQDLLAKLGTSPQQSPAFRHSPKKDKPQANFVMAIAQGISVVSIAEKEDESIGSTMLIMPVLPYALSLQIAIESITALQALHEKHLLHRDITPANTIFDLIHQKVTLIDFGLAVQTNEAGECKTFQICGSTIGYAPEIRTELNRRRDTNYIPQFVIYNEKTEVYMLGIMLAELFRLMEEVPEDMSLLEDKSYVYSEQAFKEEQVLEFNLVLPPNELKEVLGVIHEMTAEDPQSRLTLSVAKSKFQTILMNYLNKKELEQFALVPVKLLDIEAYFKLSEVELKKEWIEKAKSQVQAMDEVWFIDSQFDRSSFEYIALKREFESLGVMVGDRVFCAEDKEYAFKLASDTLNKRPVPAKIQQIESKSPEVGTKLKN